MDISEQETTETDFYVLETFEGQYLPIHENNILTEIKTLKDKFKEIDQHLTHYVPSVGNTSNTANHSDHEILEQFHQVGTEVVEKQWSPLEISLKLDSILNALSSLQSKILSEELFVWKREQQLSKNGFMPTKSLENIQSLLSQLVDLHNQSQKEIHQLGLIYETQQFKEYSSKLLNCLLNVAFIVENEPPQVMKVKTKFPHAVTLRLLLGPNIRIMNQPHVKANIISEAQANKFLNTNLGRHETSGVLSEGSSKMDLKNLTTEFKSLTLKAIERKIRRGNPQVKGHIQQGGVLTETVTDEKFCLHFHTEICINSVDYKVSTMSLPVVVITHGVQESQAWGTITWDNFCSPHRQPFEVPPVVSWNTISETLHQKFRSVTGKGLEPRELIVLQSKLFSGDRVDFSDSVSFNRLCKKQMLPLGFTFWDWYWHALKLIEKYAPTSWRNGGIYGFIGKSEAEAALRSSPPGTFLIRFSDSVLGGISICYVALNRQVFSLLPFTSKNLSFRSLTDTIWDLDNLVILYPNIPKQLAFPRTEQQIQNESQMSSPSSSSSQDSSQYIVSYPKITIPIQFS